jgi:hypothetical protein
MNPLKSLFPFPIVMVDLENEEKRRGSSHLYDPKNEGDPDLIYGEAEHPYFNFISVEDRWLPTMESKERAGSGVFDACSVNFANTYEKLVPWNKKYFKEQYLKFVNSLNLSKKEPEVIERILILTAEQAQSLMEEKKKTKKGGEEEF